MKGRVVTKMRYVPNRSRAGNIKYGHSTTVTYWRRERTLLEWLRRKPKDTWKVQR